MKNQPQSVNLIVQFDNGLCLEIRNIYVEDTNNIAKIREKPLKLFLYPQLHIKIKEYIFL